MRNKITIYLVVVVIAVLYTYNSYKTIVFSTKPEIDSLSMIVPEIPVLKVEKINEYYFDNPQIWNLKITDVKTKINLSKNKNDKGERCVNFSIKKTGKIYQIENIQGKVLQTFGIVKKKGEKFAVFYDKEKKENKIFLVKEGQKINDYLILRKIAKNSILLENKASCEKENKIIIKIFEVNLEKYKKEERK